MLRIQASETRGSSSLGWLQSRHTFSFGEYYDTERMGFGSLRVINDDKVAPGAGFGKHPHTNMEIVSYVLSGTLEHKDSMGNGSLICSGDVQRLSAGTGITHSEYNHSSTETVHFLQIWILPAVQNISPSYEQKTFADKIKRGQFCLVASPTGEAESIKLHQEIKIFIALVDGAETITYRPAKHREIWVQVAKGELVLNDHSIKCGDGVAIVDEAELIFTNGKNAEIILFDMKPLSARESKP